MKPFLYLQNRVRTDIAALLAKIIDAMRENESVESLICHSHLATITTLVATDRKALSAQLLAVIERPSPDERLLEMCLQVAFDEREQIVRGLAWVVVSRVWENPKRSSMLHKLLMSQMAERFGVRLDSADLATVASAWLDGVSAKLRALQFQRHHAWNMAKIGEHLAGDDYAAMAKDPTLAQRFLGHAEPGRRRAALSIIGQQAGGMRHLEDAVRQCALNDVDMEVRIAALACLVSMLHGARNAGVQELLARLALDELQSSRIRYFAYDQLRASDGVMASEQPLLKAWRTEPERARRFIEGGVDAPWPSEVEWEYVLRFVRKNAND